MYECLKMKQTAKVVKISVGNFYPCFRGKNVPKCGVKIPRLIT